MQDIVDIILLLLSSISFVSAKPFFRELGPARWSIGNNLWSIEIGQVYGKRLLYKGRDLIGTATGFYAGYDTDDLADGENNFQYNSAGIHEETLEYLNVVFSADEVDVHWVIFSDIAGAYQYMINKQLPILGVLRTLFRLSNNTFTHGRTHVKDALLPPLQNFLSAKKVQDETWQRVDGTYITKYDWSAFIRDMDFHGLYGRESGSWFIRPGRDYFNGDHLKQELTVHRESRTGDSVMLNVPHGSHFQADSKADFPVGKIWGPWLWYLNNGSREDAARRAKAEFETWPYSWLNDTAYLSRGEVSGSLKLSDGRPAAGASVFLGDNYSNLSTLDQGQNYHYVATADVEGRFHFQHVRAGIYAIYAWPNGGGVLDMSRQFVQNDVTVQQKRRTELEVLVWKNDKRGKKIFQIGALDRKALGFRNGGAPYQHGLSERSPGNLTYTVGRSSESDWHYAQSALGTWTIRFLLGDGDIPGEGSAAILSISLAGYAKGTNMRISANSMALKTLKASDISSDPALYRSGTTAGEWHLFEIELGNGILKSGWNEVAFEIVATKLWKGFMWDSVMLEWQR